MTIEKLNVQDEVLGDVPLYRIKDSSGKVIYDNCTIDMITSILTDGTPLNKLLFDKIDTNFDNIKTKIASMDNTIATKSPIASPTFTGTPKAPTPANGNNTTQIATTAYVNANIPLISGQKVLVDNTFTSAKSFSLTGLNLTEGKRYKLLLIVEAKVKNVLGIEMRIDNYEEEDYSWTKHIFTSTEIISSYSYEDSRRTYFPIADTITPSSSTTGLAFIEVDFTLSSGYVIFQSSFFSTATADRGISYGELDVSLAPVSSITVFNTGSGSISSLKARLLEV